MKRIMMTLATLIVISTTAHAQADTTIAGLYSTVAALQEQLRVQDSTYATRQERMVNMVALLFSQMREHDEAKHDGTGLNTGSRHTHPELADYTHSHSSSLYGEPDHDHDGKYLKSCSISTYKDFNGNTKLSLHCF